MATTMQRTNRAATPARWQAALTRAMEAGVQVRQLTSGAWIATSATDPTAAYELGVTGDVAHDCTCKAGAFGDPVCCHRAAYYHLVGLLDRDPEPPNPAAPVLVIIDGARYATRSTREEADAVAASIRRWASTSTHVAVLAA
jgi:hypothetical protein